MVGTLPEKRILPQRAYEKTLAAQIAELTVIELDEVLRIIGTS
ncbi:hypothetical protein [Sporosarcina sp. resist]|nr:hypothetical protein [Sporosarcina sp. resist]